MSSVPVAFTFGSFGDAVTLVDHAWGIGQTIIDILGSSRQWPQLRLEILTFVRLLPEVKKIFHPSPEGFNVSHTSESIKLLRDSVAQCDDTLSEMERCLSVYSSSHLLKRIFGMLRWGMVGKATFQEMRYIFSKQLAHLDIVLNILHQHSFSVVETGIADINAGTRRLVDALNGHIHDSSAVHVLLHDSIGIASSDINRSLLDIRGRVATGGASIEEAIRLIGNLTERMTNLAATVHEEHQATRTIDVSIQEGFSDIQTSMSKLQVHISGIVEANQHTIPLLTDIERLLLCVKNILSNLPQTMPTLRSVQVHDMLGKIVSFPMEQCYELRTFKMVLCATYEETPAWRFIAEGRYDITSQADIDINSSAVWASSVTPGATVKINAIIEARVAGGDERGRHKCPACGRSVSRAESGARKCRFCDTWFTVSQTANEDNEDDPDSDISTENSFSDSPSNSDPNVEQDNETDKFHAKTGPPRTPDVRPKENDFSNVVSFLRRIRVIEIVSQFSFRPSFPSSIFTSDVDKNPYHSALLDGYLARCFGPEDARLHFEHLTRSIFDDIPVSYDGSTSCFFIESNALGRSHPPIPLDLYPSPAAPTIISQRYFQPAKANRRRFRSKPEDPTIFLHSGEVEGALGLTVEQAVQGKGAHLKGWNETANQRGMVSISLRLCFPDRKSWDIPIPLKGFVRSIGRAVKRYFEENTPLYSISGEPLTSKELIILGAVPISAGSWQPILAYNA